MLSDLTLGVSSHTLTGTDLLVACIVVLSISVLTMALNRGRRVELRHSATTDILIVQLERIGDTLDRIVAQNASLSASILNQPHAVEALRSELAGKIAAIDLSKSAQQPQFESQAQPSQPAQATPPPDESVLSDPVRSVIYSMLRS